MTTFYICRHGQTENNKNQRLSGWIDTPLTPEGIINASSSAKKLRGIEFDKIISSDLGRAFITAYLVARDLGYSHEIESNLNLREVNYGDLANMPYSAYPEVTAKENTNFIAPNGESLAQMRQRVMTYIDGLGQTNAENTILLVAHDGTINAVIASFTNEDIGVVDSRGANAHDCVAKFIYDDGRIISFDKL